MRFVIGVLLVIIADQASKIWISSNLELGESIPIINKIFHFTYIQNPGSAFGLLRFSNTTFIVIGLLIILLGIIFLSKIARHSRLIFFSFILILGGSLGNLIDRLRIGSVIDFLDFRIWPIFNVADSAINIGFFFLIIHFLFQPEGARDDNNLEE
ncbi:MAG: signal peptidase II [Atribacterota bacterium]|nr:signal peptidase II [Atribacterota bacterium]MDD4896072.1 signal peptidase II [Atribacterota bacterium]MDD5636384.1 signal peptidase II [Atribacterota bacterium]